MEQTTASRTNAGKTTFLLAVLLVVASWAGAQVTISGRISAAGNNAAPNTSVQVRNTGYGASTDANGNYSFVADLKPGAYFLDVSGVNFKSRAIPFTVEAGKATYTLNAELVDDAIGMEEVVVTGTSVRTSKRELGNSISTISTRQLQNTGTPNLAGILNGRVMGAQVTQNSGDPAGGFSVRLRGVGSIFGSSEPLYIVDGVIIDNSSANVVNLNADAQGSRIQAGTNRLVDINPADIDHIEVINGAAAAAIYGSRASNGVVQIFTKRGKSGKPQVTFSVSANHNSLRRRLDLNDYPFRFGIPGSPDLFTNGDRLTTIANLRGNQSTVPGTGPAALGGRLDTVQYGVTRYDYQDQIFQSSFGTDNHIAVTGGNDVATYYLSGNYTYNGGIIRNTDFQRYGLKARVDVRPASWVKVAGGVMYTNSRSKDLPNGNNFFSPISTMNITDNVWDITEKDANGNLQHVEPVRMNPNSVIETFDIRQVIDRTLTDLKVTLTPIKGLTLDFTTGFDTYGQEGTTLQPRVPYSGVSAAFFPDGYVSAAKLKYYQWTGDAVASYKFEPIRDRLVSTTTAGYSAQYIRTAFQAQEGRDLLPFVSTVNAAQNFFSPPVDRRTEQSIYGYFLQQTFGFDNKLFVTLAGRFDGSSAFSKDARSIFYPKASVAYSLSNENFWDDTFGENWNSLKLRASYGRAGNLTGVGPYDRFITYAPLVYTGGATVPQNRIGNPNIRPEIKEEWEAGVDMSFLKGRLGFQFTYFNQKIKDLILPFNIAPSNGAASIIDNLGTMTNKGFELMITGTPVRNSKFRWDASLLVNRYRNRVTEVYSNASFIGFDASNTQGVLLGQPVGVFYINYYARNDDGSLLLRNVNGYNLPQVERGDAIKGTPSRDANGQPTGTPLRAVLGDPNPDFTMSLINEFFIGNFGIRVQVDGLYGAEVYNWDKITRNNVGIGPWAEEELRGQRTRGWTAAVGGFIGPRIQEEHVEDGSFTKLREVALSYTFNKVKFANSVKVAFVGRNLLSIDNYDFGYDPEINSAGQSFVRGTDFGAFPIPRTFQLSVITNF